MENVLLCASEGMTTSCPLEANHRGGGGSFHNPLSMVFTLDFAIGHLV